MGNSLLVLVLLAVLAGFEEVADVDVDVVDRRMASMSALSLAMRVLIGLSV